MIKKTGLFALLSILGLGVVLAQGQSKAKDFSVGAQGQIMSKEFRVGAFTFDYYVKGKDFVMTVEAPTTGWVSFGLEPDSVMKGADIIIGWVDDKSGEVFAEDHYGSGRFSHRTDEALGGSNNVTALGGGQKDGVTTITVSIPLDSGDGFDKVLEAGKEYTVIFAYGKTDQINRKHSGTGKAKILIPDTEAF